MPSSCYFDLDRPIEVYYSGETISGKVIFKTTSDENVKDIRIIFRGEGKVHWTDTEKRKKSDGTYVNETIHYRSKETYVDNDTIVFGEGTLSAGTHTYPFQIAIPKKCPTSCEERYGNIRYELILKITKESQFDNIFSKPLTVIKTQDLNLNPVYKVPVENEEIYNTCCFSCANRKITATFKMPFAAYAVGQKVNYSLHVENHSLYDIKNYGIKLVREVTFTVHSPHLDTRDEWITLTKKYYDTKCLRFTTRTFTGDFIIPSTPPSTEDRSIISIRHCIKLFLSVSGCNISKDMVIPIFIGTVALRESLSETEGDKGLPHNNKELEPPTFEEATSISTPFIDPDKDERNRHTGFRPLYPSYNLNKD